MRMTQEVMLIKLTGESLFIDKTETGLKEKIEETLRNVLDSPFKIIRFRWVHNFSFFDNENGEKIQRQEDAFVVECEVEDTTIIDSLTILLTDQEIKERNWLSERNDITYDFLKEVLCHQLRHKYPVIWGETDPIFDKKMDYEPGGKYAGTDYKKFNTKEGFDD